MAKFADNFEGWYKYAERAAGKPPRPGLVKAVERTSARGAALDMGAGALNDTIHLLSSGFAEVTALDAEPVAQAIADTLPTDRFRYVIARFEDFAFPPAAYDVINAQYALPFIHPDHFARVFADVLASLRPGGLITGQLFGDRDDWAGARKMTFQTLDEARALLSPLTTLGFREEDDPNSQTLNGTPKHWHLYHFLARKD